MPKKENEIRTIPVRYATESQTMTFGAPALATCGQTGGTENDKNSQAGHGTVIEMLEDVRK
jgi:hypothetical protein